jgi:hypothetical protein
MEGGFEREEVAAGGPAWLYSGNASSSSKSASDGRIRCIVVDARAKEGFPSFEPSSTCSPHSRRVLDRSIQYDTLRGMQRKRIRNCKLNYQQPSHHPSIPPPPSPPCYSSSSPRTRQSAPSTQSPP